MVVEKFNISLRGYNIAEVNNFVESTLREYQNMLDKLKRKDDEIVHLKEEIDKKKTIGSMTDLTVACEASSKIKDLAREEARVIVEDAKKNASRIVNDALIEAERVRTETEQAKRNMSSFKKRLRTIYQNGLDTIEDIENVDFED